MSYGQELRRLARNPFVLWDEFATGESLPHDEQQQAEGWWDIAYYQVQEAEESGQEAAAPAPTPAANLTIVVAAAPAEGSPQANPPRTIDSQATQLGTQQCPDSLEGQEQDEAAPLPPPANNNNNYPAADATQLPMDAYETAEGGEAVARRIRAQKEAHVALGKSGSKRKLFDFELTEEESLEEMLEMSEVVRVAEEAERAENIKKQMAEARSKGGSSSTDPYMIPDDDEDE